MTFFDRLPSWRRAPVFWLAGLFVLCSSVYWLCIASDRYVSEARVVLARADLSSGAPTDLASLMGGGGVANRADQLQLRDHLRSIDLLKTIDAQLSLRAHYSGQGDWLSRLWQADAPIETFHAHVQRRVSVELDEFAGVLVISAQAYTPEMAQAIGAALLSEGERYMNGLGHALANEQVEFLTQQVTELSARVQRSRTAVLRYQNAKGLVSPQATAENWAAIVSRLEAQLAELQTRRTGLQSFLQPAAPQLVEVKAQIQAVETQLAQQRARLAAPDGGRLNKSVEEFQRLQMQAEFDQTVLNTALASLERGRVDATRTLKKLQVMQSANLPEDAMKPRRLYNAAVFALVALLVAGVLQLLLAIVRDHQD